MSNLLVDNLAKADGTLSVGMQYVSRGSAKAWANLNGTGTIALRDSLNVSGVVDNGTGDYTFNFSNAISDTNFGVTFGARGNGFSDGHLNEYSVSTSRTSSSLRTYGQQAVTGILADLNVAGIDIRGTLA